MAPLAARAIIGLIFGFFIFETISESNKLFGLSLTPYLAFAIVPAVLVYVFKEYVIRYALKWSRSDCLLVQARFDLSQQI